MPNANYDEILTTTLANHRDKLVDNIFSARPLAFFLKEAGQIKLISGGHKIVIPVVYEGNSTVGAYSKYEALSTTAQDGLTAAEFSWKTWAGTISIAGIEEAQNAGTEQIIDLLEAKVMQTEEQMIEKLDDWLITSTTTEATDSSNEAPTGIKRLVADSAGTSIGGIDQTSDTWWAPGYKDTTAEAISIGRMGTAYNTVSGGNDQPNLVLTTRVLYEAYEALLQPQLRYSNSKTADAGFQNLMFKGAPVCFDTYVDAGYMYFLNTKYLQLVGHKDNWFKATPFVRPNNTDARYAQIICYGNLTVSSRRRQGVLTAKTA